MKKCGLFLGFFLLLSIGLFGDRGVIQSGHQEAVRALKMVKNNTILLSAGDDGRVKVWSLKDKELLYDILVSHRPVADLACHPEKPIFAVLVNENLTRSRFLFYNWETGQLVHSFFLDEVPLFFSFSTKGNYFFYTRADQESIVAFNPETWQQVSLFKTGFGITSFIAVGGGDKNLMAYQPSGKIQYKDIATGKDLIKKPFSTLLNLKAINISSNGRFMAASTGDSLTVVDLLSGKALATVQRPNISATLFHDHGKVIYTLVKSGEINKIVSFDFTGQELKPREDLEFNKLKDDVTCFSFAGENLYYANTMGQIKCADAAGQSVVIGENKILPVTGIAQSGGQLAISNSHYALAFPVSTLDVEKVKELSYEYYPLEMPGGVGVEFFRPNKLLFWSNGALEKGFSIIDMKDREVMFKKFDFTAPLRQLEVFSRSLLIIEDGGGLQLLNKRTFDQEYKYKDKGVNKAVVLDEDYLILARGKASQLGSALMRVNHKTGETVQINTSSLLCYDLLYDEKRDRLFTLGVKYEFGNSVSSLKVHYNKGYEKERSLLLFEGEDLNASVAMDRDYKNLYTSLGFDKISQFNGSRVTTFARTENIPRKLYVAEDFLLAINKDSSITVWNRIRRNKIMDLYFFDEKELTWVAVTPEGKSYASKEGWKYLKTYKD